MLSVHAARRVLSCLAAAGTGAVAAGDWSEAVGTLDRPTLAAWLLENDLAGLAFAAAGNSDPELAATIKPAALGAAAGNLAHFATLEAIESRFAADRLPMILLKGAAVAVSAYRDPSVRPMTDLDIWVRDEDIPRATAHLQALGLRIEAGLAHRPPALQARSRGELIFRPASGGHGLIELHFGAFQGWWIRRAADPDDAGLWNRAVPAAPGRHARRLAAEDAVLQTAFHVAVNQFGQAPFRGLMDLAVLSRAHPVDWQQVAARARSWRLATVSWLVLTMADRLIGLPGCEPALAGLRPGRIRRAALGALISPRTLLGGRDLAKLSRRHMFMLALVDRRRDGARLVGRALWPEPWWLAARYGEPVSRVRHLARLVRRGEA